MSNKPPIEECLALMEAFERTTIAPDDVKELRYPDPILQSDGIWYGYRAFIRQQQFIQFQLGYQAGLNASENPKQTRAIQLLLARNEELIEQNRRLLAKLAE